MKLKNIGLLLLICLCCLTGSVSAQKFLGEPLQKWSKEDAMKMLSNSAWAKEYQSNEGSSSAAQQSVFREQGQSVNSGGSNPRSVARNFGPPPVFIRLFSALPIRQALTRMNQINAGYDKMDDKKKAEFDESSKGFLACAICQTYYVITLIQSIDSTAQGIEEGIFQGMTLKDLKGNVFLVNEKGEQRELVQFTPPKGRGDSAVFFFARKDEKGNPFLTADNKDFKFVFKNEFLTLGNRYAGLVPRNFEFKVSKMVVGENLLF